jgi:Protein of unknown function (DUF5132)
MAFLDLKNGFSLGNIAMGAAVVLLAPMVIPIVGGIVRPFAKAAVKGGLIMYHKGREMVAEAQETVEDLAAEAKAEMSSKEEVETGGQAKKAAVAKAH